MRTITGLDELKRAEGEDLGTSDWHEVTQEAINAFADVTGDHQWIHVDVERAKDTPFGGTIAHGYYTLSLAPMLMDRIFALEGFAFAVNYGLNKVRFPAPLPVGAKVRMHATLSGARRHPGRRADDGHGHLRARGRREAGLRGGDDRARLRRRRLAERERPEREPGGVRALRTGRRVDEVARVRDLDLDRERAARVERHVGHCQHAGPGRRRLEPVGHGRALDRQPQRAHRVVVARRDDGERERRGPGEPHREPDRAARSRPRPAVPAGAGRVRPAVQPGAVQPGLHALRVGQRDERLGRQRREVASARSRRRPASACSRRSIGLSARIRAAASGGSGLASRVTLTRGGSASGRPRRRPSASIVSVSRSAVPTSAQSASVAAAVRSSTAGGGPSWPPPGVVGRKALAGVPPGVRSAFGVPSQRAW